MSYTLKVVDWRDSSGCSHPEYINSVSLWEFIPGPTDWPTKAEAEAAAEAAWIEPDCNGVAPVCIVQEC
jgi:hypothetical protein